MANPEHLAILKQGVQAWNKWRDENPEVEPELDKTDFKEATLSRVNFSGANLKKSDFSWAQLRWANFDSAVLRGAKFWGTDLVGASLRMSSLDLANLSGVELVGANLSNVVIWDTELSRANLSEVNLDKATIINSSLNHSKLNGTNFTGSTIGGVEFIDVDLSLATGLETVEHAGPSFIGIDTIYKSGGNIPEVFLRGCGVPEDFIKYIPSFVNKAIEYYSLFISYSHQDEEFARRLHADLQAQGVRCWFAPHDMAIGDKIRDRIDESIRVYDKLLIVLSHDSIFSNWVEKEVETAFEKEQRKGKPVLFPIRLDEEVMNTGKAWAADIRRARHIGDFTRWKEHDAYQAALARLLRDLKASAQATP